MYMFAAASECQADGICKFLTVFAGLSGRCCGCYRQIFVNGYNSVGRMCCYIVSILLSHSLVCTAQRRCTF